MKKQEVICDRCKKKINNKYKEFKYATTEHENNFTIFYVKNGLDLCEDCYKEIINCIYNE